MDSIAQRSFGTELSWPLLDAFPAMRDPKPGCNERVIDKAGADLLFQVFSQRYERGSTLITTNQTCKNWLRIFNKDSTMTSAVLDRVLHHAETIPREGKSFRMKDVIEEP
jgi:hypothetical protein